MQQSRQRGLVVGLGRTGLSTARYLARRGYAVAVTDDRAAPPGLAAIKAELPDVALFVGSFSEPALERADFVVTSPGIAGTDPYILRARALGLPVSGDVELFAKAARAPIVAVTGTNGKSTVTTLVGAMAAKAGREARLGGNLGTPVLDLLGDREPDLYAIELSSFQLEVTDHLPLAAAAVLNVSADHLDRYRNLEQYAAAKARIYREAAIAVVNREDPRVVAMASGKFKQRSFGLDAPAEGQYGIIGGWLSRGHKKLMPASALHIRGRHNQANALAALALGEAAGLPIESMLDALGEFRGLAHRMRFVAEAGGVGWYDDSKATNAGAAIAAIEDAEMPLIVIAGGDGKGQDFSAFADALQAHARAVVLIGRDARQIGSLLADRVAFEYADSMTDAVRQAAGLAKPGDRVVLAPACASTDMFEDYRARGEAFIGAVREIAS